MSTQPTTNPAGTIAQPSLLGAFPEIDDDEADADWDDDDEDIVAPGQARWFSRAGFGSPEWWSR
jgi:hypothetical protein